MTKVYTYNAVSDFIVCTLHVMYRYGVWSLWHGQHGSTNGHDSSLYIIGSITVLKIYM